MSTMGPCKEYYYYYTITDFLADIRSLRERYDSSIPTLVHCSAGVGRSGVVVLMDMLMAKVDCGDVRAQKSVMQYLNHAQGDNSYQRPKPSWLYM